MQQVKLLLPSPPVKIWPARVFTGKKGQPGAIMEPFVFVVLNTATGIQAANDS
jgi:hypothetical protein